MEINLISVNFVLYCLVEALRHSTFYNIWLRKIDVEKCPLKQSTWDETASRLNCFLDKNGRNTYYCVPEQDKSFLLEFCYGYDRLVGLFNEDPDYQDINTDDRCFIAEPTCPNKSRDFADTSVQNTTTANSTLHIFNNGTTSTNITENYPGFQISMVIPHLGFPAFFIVFIFILWRRRRRLVEIFKRCKGNTEKGNMKFKQYEGSAFEKERVMIEDGARYAGFRKGEQDMQRLIVSDVKSRASHSIGLVYFKDSKQGTCFRVGDNYVMTNTHVIKSIITDDGRRLTENVKIVFEYKTDEVIPSLEDKRKIFDLETEIEYRNYPFDVVLLQLKPCAVYPPPLTMFGKLQYDEPVYLIGHSGGDVMLEDRVQLMKKDETLTKKIKEADSFLKDKYKTSIDYYTHLFSDQNIVIFNTAFKQGSSGSPGIVVGKGKPCVIMILSGGVPTCYYEDPIKYRSLPNECMFEIGYSMKDVSEEMKKTHPHLEKNIFRYWLQ